MIFVNIKKFYQNRLLIGSLTGVLLIGTSIGLAVFKPEVLPMLHQVSTKTWKELQIKSLTLKHPENSLIESDDYSTIIKFTHDNSVVENGGETAYIAIAAPVYSNEEISQFTRKNADAKKEFLTSKCISGSVKNVQDFSTSTLAGYMIESDCGGKAYTYFIYHKNFYIEISTKMPEDSKFTADYYAIQDKIIKSITFKQ